MLRAANRRRCYRYSGSPTWRCVARSPSLWSEVPRPWGWWTGPEGDFPVHWWKRSHLVQILRATLALGRLEGTLPWTQWPLQNPLSGCLRGRCPWIRISALPFTVWLWTRSPSLWTSVPSTTKMGVMTMPKWYRIKWETCRGPTVQSMWHVINLQLSSYYY